MKKRFFGAFAAALCCMAGLFIISACGGNTGTNGDGSESGDNGGSAKTEFASGTGTQDDPYVISEDNHWVNISKHPDSSFVLSCDINLGGYDSVKPIGSAENPFTGTVDGKNHKITGAKVRSTSNAGLFGIMSGATVKNLGFENSSVHLESKNDDDVLASFAAVARKGTVIENCYSEKVTINFTKYSVKYVMIGGFVGSLESVSSVVCCHSNVNIKAPDGSRFYIGGFARLVSGSAIDCCYAKGTINVWGPSGKEVCRIGTFVDRVINSDVTDMYTEMDVNAKGATGVYYFAGNVDEETLKFCLNFCSYQQTPDGKYQKCGVEYNSSQYVNKYFAPSEYATANDIFNDGLWQTNKYWKAGKIHPVLVSYEEYLQIKAGQENLQD